MVDDDVNLITFIRFTNSDSLRRKVKAKMASEDMKVLTVSKESELSLSTVSKFLNGKLPNPTIGTVDKILRAVGMKLLLGN